MAGPTDIASILSQSGRIERVTQNPLVHAEIHKQILTEQEARERTRLARQVNESKRVQEAADRQRRKDKREASKKKIKSLDETDDQTAEDGIEKKHLVDVVI